MQLRHLIRRHVLVYNLWSFVMAQCSDNSNNLMQLRVGEQFLNRNILLVQDKYLVSQLIKVLNSDLQLTYPSSASNLRL